MKKIILTIIGLPAVFLLFGIVKMTFIPDAEGAREAHRDQVNIKCLEGSTAKPDEMYCKGFAEMHMGITNLLQELLAEASFSILPHSFSEPYSQAVIWKLKTDIERHASFFGSDGSTRFTGEHEEEFRARERKESCSPDDPLMKQFEGEEHTLARIALRKAFGCNEK